MKFTPIADKVIIRKLTDEESAEANPSGILLPDAAAKTNHAIVVAVGEGVYDTRLEKHITPPVKVGDRIVHTSLAMWEEKIKYDGVDCLIIRESDILAYGEAES